MFLYKKNKKLIIRMVIIVLCFIIATFLAIVANKSYSKRIQDISEDIIQGLDNGQKLYMDKYKLLLEGVGFKMLEAHNSSRTITVENIKEMSRDYAKVLEIEDAKLHIIMDGNYYDINNSTSTNNYKETEWYKKVEQAEIKEMIITNSYLYNDTDELIMTAAMKLDSNHTVAVDIFIERINTWPDINDLPKGTCYYVINRNGKLIHQENNDPEIKIEDTRKSIEKLSNHLEGKKRTLFEMVFSKEGVYTKKLDNGWSIIVKIPYKDALSNTRTIFIIYYSTTIIFALLTIYLVSIQRKEMKSKDLYNRISRILGESYYAVYLIDFRKETYTIYKGGEYIKDVLPKYGKYSDLIDCFENVIEEDAYEEFKETFSIENVRKLVKSDAQNFGGDYKRKFGNEYKWVNINMLYNKESIENNKNEVIFGFQNIDEKKQKQLEEKTVLLDSVHTIQMSTQAKNKFFANMSHDMRTPLNAIINFSKMSADYIDNKEKVLDYLNKINISSTQLLELINDILEVSKMEENTSLVNNVTTNITEKMKDELSVFMEQAKSQYKNLQITYNVKHDFVLCDWGKIRQIVNNILSNALKYTNTNGNIQVEINEIEGKFVSKYEFKVTDDGIGMSKEFLERIYIPFERETRFHSKEMSGTGLGMSIVQNNVQKLNGQIEIKSEHKKGSQVYVVLPLEISKEVIENKKEVEEALQDLNGKRILIVEDNELNMEISTEILEMRGVKLTKAYNGKQAVELFANSTEGYFDAILMDIQMPIMDGYEATRTIRSLNRRDAKSVTILAVTASLFADEILKIEQSGMNDYVGKPIDFKELQKVLAKYIRRGN